MNEIKNFVLPDELDRFLFFYFRYSLGRRSYIPAVCKDDLFNHWSELKPTTRQKIKQEISKAIESGNAGMNCDIRIWKQILEWDN